MSLPSSAPIVIAGAGPAGLTAAHELCKSGVQPVLLESDEVVGGLSRTGNYKGYLFDVGGHRFYTKVAAVEKLWRETLGEDLLTRPRLSRIYYKSRFFRYPLEPLDALRGLGGTESIRCGLSYLKASLAPKRPEDSFESWVVNRFGRRLFETFFKTYTEKVWGIPCNEIHPDWASQRIRGLSMKSLVMDALRRHRPAADAIKTLITSFEYPRLGPGMMWERLAETVQSTGARIFFNSPVERIHWRPGEITAITSGDRTWHTDHFISSMPVRDLVHALDPAPPDELRKAADSLAYRDFLTVVLIVREPELFPDNWIYVHDPNVRVGRIQNYKNWSPEMVPDPATTSLGMEYFCSEGDEIWSKPDHEIVELARKEIARIGLARADRVVDGFVLRMRKAYPVYDGRYIAALETVKDFVGEIPNLQLVGRNGMHRYNNQDHSMLTGMLAARNILGAQHDLWRVNVDAGYLEEMNEKEAEELAHLSETQPCVPQRVTT